MQVKNITTPNERRLCRALQIAENRIKASKVMKYVKELYLYGSLATGNTNWESDVDLLLVLDETGLNNKDLKREILFLKGNLAEDDLDAPEIDLKIVFGDEWRHCNQIYYTNILKDGKKIW